MTMFKKFSIFKSNSKKSSKNEDFDSFRKEYQSLFISESSGTKNNKLLGQESCRLVIIMQDNNEPLFDSSQGYKPTEFSPRNTIHYFDHKKISEIAFGHCLLEGSRSSPPCMKVHTFPKTDEIMISLISQMKKSQPNDTQSTEQRNTFLCLCQHNTTSTSTSSTSPQQPSSSSSSSSSSASSSNSPPASTSLPLPLSSKSPNIKITDHCGKFTKSGSLIPNSFVRQRKRIASLSSSMEINHHQNNTSMNLDNNYSSSFSHNFYSPGSQARLMRNKISGLPSSSTLCENEILSNHHNNSIESQHQQHQQQQQEDKRKTWNNYLAICILFSPPESFQNISLQSACNLTEKFQQQLQQMRDTIKSRWYKLIGSPFLRQLFQHMVIMESVLHYVMHETHCIINNQHNNYKKNLSKTTKSITIQSNSSSPSSASFFTTSSSSTTSSLTTSASATATASRNYSFNQIYDKVLQRLSDILFAPRLQNPMWLSLTANDKRKPDGSGVSLRQIHSTQLFVKDCLLKMIHQYHEKYSQPKTSFLCRFLTSVLTHHPYWICTVIPNGGKLSKKHLSKHKATWVDSLVRSNPYNAEWAQLNDLFSGVTSIESNDSCYDKQQQQQQQQQQQYYYTDEKKISSVKFLRTFCRTIIVGKNQQMVNCLLYLMTYFIRCANADIIMEECVPEIARGDIFEVRERRRRRSTSSQIIPCGSSVGGDSGVSMSMEDLNSQKNSPASSTAPYCSQTRLNYYANLPPTSGISSGISRSGSNSSGLQKCGILSPEQMMIARACAMGYSTNTTSSACNNSQTKSKLAKSITNDYMDVPLLLQSRRLTCEELWHQLCPEILQNNCQLQDLLTSQDIHIALGGCSPLLNSIAYSMFTSCGPKYLEGSAYALQGTTESYNHWQEQLKMDIKQVVDHHCLLDEPVDMSLAIVADIDSGIVRTISYCNDQGFQEHQSSGSLLVANMLHSVQVLGDAGLPSQVLLQQVEHILGEIYQRSRCIIDVLHSNEPQQKQMVYKMLNLDDDDISLVTSVAHVIDYSLS